MQEQLEEEHKIELVEHRTLEQELVGEVDKSSTSDHHLEPEGMEQVEELDCMTVEVEGMGRVKERVGNLMVELKQVVSLGFAMIFSFRSLTTSATEKLTCMTCGSTMFNWTIAWNKAYAN